MVDHAAKVAAINDALQAIDGIQAVNSKNEFAELPNVLEDAELPEMAVKGTVGIGNGLAVATDRRVVWLRKGRNLDVRDMLYTVLVSVEGKPGRMSGEIAFSSTTETLVITNTTKHLTLPFAEFVREKANITESIVEGESKTATIMEAVRSIDTSGTFSGKWEIRKLPEILNDGELPRMITSGSYKGTRSRSAGIGVLVATDRRVLFIDKGLFNSLTVEDFPYSTIQSVEASTGMMWGTIVIKSAGNAEEIGNLAKERTHAFANVIRDNVRESQSPSSVIAPATVAPPVSLADELLKLAQLRDAGILSEEEFEGQKAKLLG